jgi:hypothetical protein
MASKIYIEGEVACPDLRRHGNEIRKKCKVEKPLTVDLVWSEVGLDWSEDALQDDDELCTWIPAGLNKTRMKDSAAKRQTAPVENRGIRSARRRTPTVQSQPAMDSTFRTLVDACGGPSANVSRMLHDVPSLSGSGLNDLAKHLKFGPAAFGPIGSATLPVDDCTSNFQTRIAEMLEQSVDGVQTMRGQRGERLVTDMMTSWYTQGLFMHGSPDSPVNRLVIPATKHIFACMAHLPARSAKRVDCFTTLALSCQDCQQVQAREIMRIFGDLTSQNATLDEQLKYSLVRSKEVALNCVISKRHPQCDLDHTKVQPWQQRVHLFSGYVSTMGDSFGLDSVTTANSDRFLAQAKAEIGKVDAVALIRELQSSISVAEWLQCLLADINNQSEDADRLIDRACIFKWVQANMSHEASYSVFYDEDRSDEFVDQDPKQPTPANKFEPFLSCKVLVHILLTAGMLVWKLK